MLQPRQHFVRSLSPHGFHRVAYREWGHPASSRTLVCVHGLTRNGRDFDVLAAALADRFRVLCPDMPGRGDSEWLKDPNDYVFPTYLTALTAVLAHADVDEVSWLGTSMGGLLGMVLAAQPATPIKRLVVNDIGPAIEPAALLRIAGYVGLDPVFDNFKALEAHVREVSAPFGALSDAQWTALAESTARQTTDGRWKLKYDPGIAVPFRSSAGSGNLWAIWDAIRCPTLLLRGSESDLLSVQTAAAMRTRGPKPRLIEFAGVGHAPMLFNPEQIAPVVAFLGAA
ncbi:MAG TPA: alpha/beta hydrolase [Casimicrobiaceae bacterium]|nr:alpha/beta hydrolase [Casimicrobiaceae bacterium]